MRAYDAVTNGNRIGRKEGKGVHECWGTRSGKGARLCALGPRPFRRGRTAVRPYIWLAVTSERKWGRLASRPHSKDM